MPTYKLFSWNVNGLRAVAKKGFPEYLAACGADCFCLQEIKLQREQMQAPELQFPDYSYWADYAEKKGYSGTAIFSKHEPLSARFGIGADGMGGEGRVVTLEFPEFFLVCCYTPNSQHELARLPHRMNWDAAFREYVSALDKRKPVVMCGDFNVAHNEIDIKNPKSNRGNAGFSDEERESFTRLLDAGFVDTFRALHPDEVKYSWWAYFASARERGIGWRIDYFLVSERLRGAVKSAEIHDQVFGSDHCPVSIELKIDN